MSELEKLTPEQEALLPVIRDKWINKLNNPKPFDKQKAIKAVEWLYQFSGLEKPKVIVSESPLGCYLAMDLLDSIGNSVWASVRASVRNSIESPVLASVWDSVSASIRNTVWASVRASTEASVSNKYYDRYAYGDISSYGWTAFSDFFKEIGILKDRLFDQWLEYCDAGIFYALQRESVCAICPMPKYVKRNSEQAMHCEDGYAIEWADGYGIYVLDGISFDREGQDELYWKIVRKELTLPEILQIQDIDQRAIALKYCNAEVIIAHLIKQGQAELVDTATKQASYLEHDSVEFIHGIAQINFAIEKPKKVEKELKYSLYKVNITNILEGEYMLVYPHASIEGLSYWKGVDPETAKGGSIASIADSHNMTVDEYLLSTSQS